MKPARRHESLIPLSREHHYALMLCLRIHRGLKTHQDDSAWLQSKAENVIRFLASDLIPHFQAEEEVLFPAMQPCDGATALLRELLAEHREMERLAAGLRQCEAGLLAAQLNAFADLLEAHIRREERELFPLFEQQVTPEMAQQIGQGIIRLIGQAEQPRVPELLR
ncbi:MAG TPA: hemerythrin domain-containing protein [Blastocatellia bacterium]|nr:hemerythrin domain-containing protein [Acidobacteriota bacterium]HMX30156.1 hemerythrin domain-containing protein [Blastocatellia bacterium]